ncbi:MAG: hypothetical protein JXA30_03675 [Deltaproteobacteria bacterium]|nr:hypothetical protein [Deltaproteobacteria bacterium]
MKVINYRGKADRLFNRGVMKYRRFAATALIGGFVFAVACVEESKNADAVTGSDSAVPALGSGGSGDVQIVETGGTSKAPKQNTGGAGGAGGTSVTRETGGAKAEPDATVLEPLDSGLDDGNAPEPTVDAATEPQTDSTIQTGSGTCCPDGNCLCHGPDPTELTSTSGPFHSESYSLAGAGCVFYPTDAEPPFAAVAVADGFMGAGGCMSFQTGQWGPFYASWGIVAMIVNTGAADVPQMRASALLRGVEAFKAENENSGSPLFGKLAGRYSTSGFSMGGGGTTIASSQDSTLFSSVAIMPWAPTGNGLTVPTLFICGSMDALAGCAMMGTPAYNAMPETTPKMQVTIASPHMGQPSSGMGVSGQYGLAFQKVFLEGDERWRPILLSGNHDMTNIELQP